MWQECSECSRVENSPLQKRLMTINSICWIAFREFRWAAAIWMHVPQSATARLAAVFIFHLQLDLRRFTDRTDHQVTESTKTAQLIMQKHTHHDTIPVQNWDHWKLENEMMCNTNNHLKALCPMKKTTTSQYHKHKDTHTHTQKMPHLYKTEIIQNRKMRWYNT